MTARDVARVMTPSATYMYLKEELHAEARIEQRLEPVAADAAPGRGHRHHPNQERDEPAFARPDAQDLAEGVHGHIQANVLLEQRIRFVTWVPV